MTAAALTAKQAALVGEARPLARSLARRAARNGEADDLEQAALLAAIRAAQRFDPDRGTKWTTFAYPWLTGAIKAEYRSLHPADEEPLSLDFEYEEGGSFHEAISAPTSHDDEALPPREALAAARRELEAAEYGLWLVHEARRRARTCGCGCEGSLVGRRRNVRYVADAHRSATRRHKEATLAPIRAHIETLELTLGYGDDPRRPSCEHLMQLDWGDKRRPIPKRPWRGEADGSGIDVFGDGFRVAQAARSTKRDVQRGGNYAPNPETPKWKAQYHCETTWADVEAARRRDAGDAA